MWWSASSSARCTAHAGAPSLQARLQLAQAARVDGDDEVDLRRLNLIELVVEDALGVAGAQDAVGARRAAALRGGRELDVLADLLDELPGLAEDAHPVAEMAGGRALAAAQRAQDVAARDVLDELAAGADHLAGGQDGLAAGQVVARDPVPRAPQPPAFSATLPPMVDVVRELGSGG